jgi:excisionase family DNA binding protein
MSMQQGIAKARPFLSVEEAALLLGEARSTVYRAVKAGTFPLPVVRIGDRLRIPRSAVDRLIAGDVPALAKQPLSLEGR